jgi:hypothetical protein
MRTATTASLPAISMAMRPPARRWCARRLRRPGSS